MASQSNNVNSMRVLTIIDELRKVWDGMPMSVASLFIAIAQSDNKGDPLTITEAGDQVGMKLASTSRNIKLLAHGMAERGTGPIHLVEVKDHPRDYRRKVVVLTPKGRELFDRLCAVVD